MIEKTELQKLARYYDGQLSAMIGTSSIFGLLKNAAARDENSALAFAASQSECRADGIIMGAVSMMDVLFTSGEGDMFPLLSERVQFSLVAWLCADYNAATLSHIADKFKAPDVVRIINLAMKGEMTNEQKREVIETWEKVEAQRRAKKRARADRRVKKDEEIHEGSGNRSDEAARRHNDQRGSGEKKEGSPAPEDHEKDPPSKEVAEAFRRFIKGEDQRQGDGEDRTLSEIVEGLIDPDSTCSICMSGPATAEHVADHLKRDTDIIEFFESMTKGKAN